MKEEKKKRCKNEEGKGRGGVEVELRWGWGVEENERNKKIVPLFWLPTNGIYQWKSRRVRGRADKKKSCRGAASNWRRLATAHVWATAVHRPG